MNQGYSVSALSLTRISAVDKQTKLILTVSDFLSISRMNEDLNNGRPSPSQSTGRKIRIAAITTLAILSSLAGLYGFAKLKTGHERAKWEKQALQQICELTITNEIIRQDLENLRVRGSDGKPRWAGDHVLLMTNGEYIIYAYRHGANNGFPDHLFLGHASNGRWLYSTFHFCNYMAMIQGEDTPSGINDFAKRYAAREFDGKSDECLKHTWP